MEVGGTSDLCKSPGADALDFKKLLEKVQYLFLRPIAQVNSVACMDPARDDANFWIVSSWISLLGNGAFCMTSFPAGTRRGAAALLTRASIAHGLPLKFSPIGLILQARNIAGFYQES